jgi:hypothetical protein
LLRLRPTITPQKRRRLWLLEPVELNDLLNKMHPELVVEDRRLQQLASEMAAFTVSTEGASVPFEFRDGLFIRLGSFFHSLRFFFTLLDANSSLCANSNKTPRFYNHFTYQLSNNAF